MKIINSKRAVFLFLGIVLFFSSCLKEETSFQPDSPASLRFTDSDLRKGQLEGNIAIERAADETNVVEYVLWWGSQANFAYPGLGQIAVLPKTGQRFATRKLPESIPSGATHILACSRNDNGDSGSVRQVAIMDSTGKIIQVPNSAPDSNRHVRVIDLIVPDDGMVYVTGSAKDGMADVPLYGRHNPGRHNVFTAKFDEKLIPLWLDYKKTSDEGQPPGDFGGGIAVEVGAGDYWTTGKGGVRVYVYGATKGDMFAARNEVLGMRQGNLGGSDFFWFGYDKIEDRKTVGYMESAFCFDGAGEQCVGGTKYARGTQFGTPGMDGASFARTEMDADVNSAAIAFSHGILYTAGEYESANGYGIMIGIQDMAEGIFYRRALESGRSESGGHVSNEKNDFVRDIAADEQGNVYIVGNTEGNLGLEPDANRPYAKSNAFFMRFPAKEMFRSSCGGDSCGHSVADLSEYALPLENLNAYWVNSRGVECDEGEEGCQKYLAAWNRQTGSNGDDAAMAVALDGSGNVYVAGYVRASTDSETDSRNAFIYKLTERKDGNGKRRISRAWSKEIGGAGYDAAVDIAVDNYDNVYLLMKTNSAMFGTQSGGRDIALIKYSASGSEIWARQLGTACDDNPMSVDVDGNGNVYIGGFSVGSLDELSFRDNALCYSSETDSFIIKMEQ